MIYDCVERVADHLRANFDTEMAAVATAKGETGLTTTAKVFEWRSIETMLEAAYPAICVYAGATADVEVPIPRGGTADSDTRAQISVEYVAKGTDPRKIEVQLALAAEAVRNLMLDVWPSGTVWGAGPSLSFSFNRPMQDVESELYENYWHAFVPIQQRDTVT